MTTFNEIIDIEGKQYHFILGMVDQKDAKLVTWLTEIDDFMMIAMSSTLYKAIEDHPKYCIRLNMEDKKDYAALMKFKDFESMLLTREADIFKQAVIKLRILSKKLLAKCTSVYVTFGSNDSENAVNCIIDNAYDTISFGARMNTKEEKEKKE